MNRVFSKQASIRTKIAFALMLVCSLFACQTTNQDSKERASYDDLGLENKINQDKSVKRAITLLEKGNKKKAFENINRVLRFNPKHKTAKLIHVQLTKNIDQIFSSKRYHDYKIKSSDSLGSIAQTWLGNSIYFITLARSNHIENPSLIKAGQIIRIPVLNFSPLVKKEKRRSKANIALIKSTMKKDQYVRALQQMNKLFILKSEHQILVSTQLQALSSISDKAITIPERKQTIRRLISIKNETKQKLLLPAYQYFIRKHEQNIFIDEFLLLFEDNSYRESAKKLIKAKTIKGFDDNLKRVIETESKLINKLHEEAIIFRKKQQLDDALTSWSLILLINENNTLAIKYHERTLKLLERLKNL
ncbi:MAG: hypothetical protein COA86_16880 [Kangiella sp.]|nr:MAG: hypothetical protein COA86_16880 [Kangiella sp.]